MANTLYLVEDDVFTALPDAVRKKTLAETTRLLAFIPHFSVETRAAALFPAALDFTEAAVKIVDSDGDVGSVQNEIHRQQSSNLQFSIKQKSVGLKIEAFQRVPATPERGGVAYHWKLLQPIGSSFVTITLTYGVASVESAKEAVVEYVTNGRTKVEIERDQNKRIAKEGLAHYYGSHQALIDVRDESENELLDKPLSQWPLDHQEWVGLALGRLVAHEARHQYVLEHFKGPGLGADSPTLWGDKNFEQFDKSDQADVVSKIVKFGNDWKKTAVHLELFPKGQPSPFS